MNAMHKIDLIVLRPAQRAKPVRVSPPTLDQMRTEAAIVAALTQRDKLWSEAVRAAGGVVQS